MTDQCEIRQHQAKVNGTHNGPNLPSLQNFHNHLLYSRNLTIPRQITKRPFTSYRRRCGGLPPVGPWGQPRQRRGIIGSSPTGRHGRWSSRHEKSQATCLAFRVFRSEATWGCLRGRSPFNQDRRSLVIQTKKTEPRWARFFDVWTTGLEPATSWSLTRCATNCATSRGPFFKGTANIGILFRKNKRRTTYFSAGPRTGPRDEPAQASGLGAVRLS